MRKISRISHVIPQGGNSQVENKQPVVGAEGWEKTTPFLFLSEDWFGAPKRFEEHPHRGMQTVTVVLEGALEHRDHTGAHGILQLWLNLPRKMKMIPARYQDQRLADVPVGHPAVGGRVKAGNFYQRSRFRLRAAGGGRRSAVRR